MCEMLTAVGNSSKRQMVFALEAGEVAMRPGRQTAFAGREEVCSCGDQRQTGEYHP